MSKYGRSPRFFDLLRHQNDAVVSQKPVDDQHADPVPPPPRSQCQNKTRDPVSGVYVRARLSLDTGKRGSLQWSSGHIEAGFGVCGARLMSV